MSQVQIQIVTWNSRPHLERLWRGIQAQTGVDYNIVVVDNGSGDGTVSEISNFQFPISKQIPNSKLQIIKNSENLGFAKAHNQGFAICRAPYMLVLNPDTELQEGYLAEVIRVMESDKKIAAVQGKLYRELPRPPLNPPLDKGGRWGGIIDSCGLEMRRFGKVADIGQNQADKGNFGLQKEVWGVTGACALYRLEALKQVADRHGIFDERFGSYKEDVDLAWRLRRAGWKAMFTPKAIAWHGRGVGRGDEKSWKIRLMSWRNQVLMVAKNLFGRKWKIENGR